jgi:hypothetical protein
MLDHLDAVSVTNQRQHETRWTLWNINHNTGLTFGNREAAAAAANAAQYPCALVEPLYRSES